MPRRTNSLEFARKSRVLLLQHKRHGVNVDISLAALPFEQEMIDRAVHVRIEDVDVRLATPEDLIVMKALAMRPNDITDIVSLVEANERIDLKRVRSWVRSMADALDSPEIVDRLESVLATVRTASSGASMAGAAASLARISWVRSSPIWSATAAASFFTPNRRPQAVRAWSPANFQAGKSGTMILRISPAAWHMEPAEALFSSRSGILRIKCARTCW